MGARRTGRKREERPVSPENRTRMLFFLLAVGLCLLTLKTVGCPLLFQKTIPDALRGTWSTTDAKMQDRTFQLTDRLVIFGLGQKHEQVCAVDRVESKKTVEGVILYKVHYHDDDDAKWTLEFGYDPASGGMIRLKHRSELWRREGGEVRI